jgi:1,4-alpha-glucan branching enzyme
MKKKSHVHEAHSAANSQPPLKREYSRDKTRCRVTFWLPQAAVPGATTVAVAGSFNDWSVDRHPMAQLASGDFHLELELEAGREHEFRFFIDGVRWENAWNADKYVWSDHAQCENSAIVL